MWRIIAGGFASIVVALLVSGCSSALPFYRVSPLPTQHVVLISGLGRPLDPTGNRLCYEHGVPKLDPSQLDKWVQPQQSLHWKPCEGSWNRFRFALALSDVDYSNYLEDQFAAMDSYFDEREKAGKTGPRHIVIFFHGGLNNTQSSLKRVRDDALAIMNDGYYPIFINWQSALTSAWLDHEFKVRQGEYRPGHWFIAIPYLLSDLGKSVGRAPAVWFYNLASDWETAKLFRNRNHHTRADTAYDKFRAEYDKNCADPSSLACKHTIAISRGENNIHRKQVVESTATFGVAQLTPARVYLHVARAALHEVSSSVGTRVTSPFMWLPPRFLTSPFLDGLGGPSWDMMIRHYQLAFENNNDRGSGESDGVITPSEGSGAASEFFRALCAHLNDPQHPERKWEITLIGHSMGTFMVNETISRFPELPIRDVVYLAAACTIEQYESTAYPYLKAHPDVRWHHVMLHEMAERRESDVFVTPRGSLLLWIDSFFSNPTTLRQRTAGRYENLLLALSATPIEIRGQISVKTFGIGVGDPEVHHEVGVKERKYWREEYWRPKAPATAESQAPVGDARH